MEKEIMCASILTAIILCIVGIIKILPFCLSFKEKHPKWYKGIFYGISLILAVILPIISELYILKGTLASMNFFVLAITTVAGVFGLYGTYEGTSLKELINKLIAKVGELFKTFGNKKLARTVAKVGLDKLTIIDAQNKENEAKKLADEEAKKMAKEAKLKEKEEKKLAKAKELVAKNESATVTENATNIDAVETQQVVSNQSTQSTQVNSTPANQAMPTNTTNVF